MRLISEIRAEWLFRKGQKLHSENKVDRSIETLEESVRLCDYDYRTRLHLALAQCRSGNLEGALSTLDAIPKTKASGWVAALFRGKVFYEHESYSEALSEFESCLKGHPKNIIAWNYKAFSHQALGQTDEAVKILKQHGVLDNIDGLCHFCMIFGDRFYQPSIVTVEDSEDDTDVESASDEDKFVVTETEKSIGFFARLRRKFKVRRLIDKGDKAFYKDRFDQAEQRYREAYRLNPKSAEVLWGLGIIHYHLGKYSEARKFLADANDRCGKVNNPTVYSYLGRVCIELGQFDEATEWLLKIEEEGPEDYGKFYYLGLSHLLKGDRQKAFSNFRKGFSNYFIGTFEDCFLTLKQRVLSSKKG